MSTEQKERMGKVFIVVDYRTGPEGLERTFSAYGDYVTTPKSEWGVLESHFPDWRERKKKELHFLYLGPKKSSPEELGEQVVACLREFDFPTDRKVEILHPSTSVGPSNIVPGHMHNRTQMEKNELNRFLAVLKANGFEYKDWYAPNFRRYDNY